ncbi:MAG: hypothetical protein ACYC26_15925 [Phycisphaerales bacterium]
MSHTHVFENTHADPGITTVASILATAVLRLREHGDARQISQQSHDVEEVPHIAEISLDSSANPLLHVSRG